MEQALNIVFWILLFLCLALIIVSKIMDVIIKKVRLEIEKMEEEETVTTTTTRTIKIDGTAIAAVVASTVTLYVLDNIFNKKNK